MTKLTTVELLMKARNRIKGRFIKKQLYQRDLLGETERVCAIGALYDQGIERLNRYHPTGRAVISLKVRYPELDGIARETGQCIGNEYMSLYGLEGVPLFNDSTFTNEETVLSFFDKAIEVAAKKNS